MHVAGLPLDLNWLLQLIFAAFFVALGLLHVAKNAASKFFLVDANFEGGGSEPIVNGDMPAVSRDPCVCAVCGNSGNKKCSGCKAIRYCSHACQSQHWRSGHRTTCRNNQLYGKTIPMQSKKVGLNFSCYGGSRGLALIPDGGTKTFKLSNKVLFPYDDFRKLFSWEIHGFPPCGLINCGNSCFVNVVLQCLMYTRPLTAYLLEKGHRGECRRNDWCFMCELQTHVERASKNACPFSPKNILSRLPCIGGNLGYGKQEDAHEFMRFAIDTLQSTCLDEFGGEKALHPKSQETTLIQHIFGGHLQSQIICTKCNKISNQYENMMDLTVEIHGEVASLEECLEQFTVKEWLHGENMYKCDECSDYVKAWKRLTIKLSPNILTIALKRFQSGRFTKLNKRITFPETLDLSPYMSDGGDGTDTYKLYAVVVHVDMLNASFFGHYICYIKDFSGSWFRVDDCKVEPVELEVALSQRAYMLLYRRISARKPGLFSTESSRAEEEQAVGSIKKSDPCQNQRPESIANTESIDPTYVSGPFLSVNSNISDLEDVSPLLTDPQARKNSESAGTADRISCSPASKNANGSLAFVDSKCEPEDSSPSGHNGFCEEDERETIVATNPLYNRKKTEEIKSGEELQNSGHVPNGGNSRGPKPKPLFPPGFLLNQPHESRPGGFLGKMNNYCNGLAKIQQKDMNG